MRKNKLTKEFLDAANELGLNIVLASSKRDNLRVAIHLLEPTEHELFDALDVAAKDLFPCIVIHSKKTWPSL